MKDNIFSKIKKSVSNFIKSSGSYFNEFKTFGSWGSVFSMKRQSEEKLINESYISNVDVFSVIDLVVQTALTLNILLHDKKKDGSLELIDSNSNDSFYDLINKPNKEQTQKEYRNEQFINYLLTGNLFEYKMIPIGFKEVDSLRILPSQFVEIEQDPFSTFFDEGLTFCFSFNSKSNTYNSEDIIFTKKLDPSYCEQKGLSPFQAGYRALSTSNQVHEAEESLMINRGASGMVSSGSNEYPLSAEEKTELDDNFKERTGGAKNYNKTITVGSNVKYQSLGLSPKDLTLTEIDINKLRKFCNMFHLSSQLLNDTANSTYNNISEAKKSLYTESAIPLAENILDGWRENLIPVFNKLNNKDYVLSLDTSKVEVLQKDKKAEAEKNKIIIETVSNLSEKVYTNRISYESAIQSLVFSFKMTQKEAELLIPNQKTEINGEK